MDWHSRGTPSSRPLLLTTTPLPAVAGLLRDGAKELANYLLFADEVPVAGKIRGTSGFAEKFSGARADRLQGPLLAAARSAKTVPAVSVVQQGLPEYFRPMS